MPRRPLHPPACLRTWASLPLPLLLASLLLWGFPSASVLAAPEADGAERKLFDPRFREGAASDLVEKGPPRLTRGHLNAFIDLFEAAFDVALPASVERDLRHALQQGYGKASDGQRESLLVLVDALGPLKCRSRCCDWHYVQRGLRQFRAAIDKRLRVAPASPANQVMLKVLRRRHEVVWRGDPVVKALAVEAYLEMVVFVTSLGRNEPIELSPGQVKALRDYLGKDLHRCHSRTRSCLVSAHRTWLRAKARWDRSRDARRFAMRWESARLLGRLAPQAGGVKISPGSGQANYAREASKVRKVDTAFNAVTALARNPKSLMESLCRGLGIAGKPAPYTFLFR